METFTFSPAQGAAFDCKPSVNTAKYGDGYEQRVANGINTKARKWSLKFTQEVPAVLAFLEARDGVDAFLWRDPLGVAGIYVCSEWNMAHVGGNHYELTCDFRQVFE